MNKPVNKYANRGVSAKPILLRLPKEIHAKALESAAENGISLNRHATELYLIGLASTKAKSASRSNSTKPSTTNHAASIA